MQVTIKYIQAIVLLLLFGYMQVTAQTEKDLIRKGNKEYEAGKYEEAEKSYRAALDENGNSVEGSFNLGDAAYKQENYDDAINHFELQTKKVGTPEQIADSYHNLGNSYMKKKEYEKSVQAYKHALRNNPSDRDTKYNLAYAQQKLKQQQQQEQQQKENKDKNENDEKKEQEKKDKEKDKEKDKDKEDQEKKEEDKKKDEEEKKDKEKKEEDKNQDEKKDQKQDEQQKGSKPDQLSQEEARKILEALKNKEMDLQDKLQKKKLKGTKIKTDKDW